MILNDTSLHIINDFMTALPIKAGYQFSVFFTDWYLNFIPVSPRFLHPDYWVNGNIFHVSTFFHNIFHLILFHLQLHRIAHMLQLTAAAFMKNSTGRCFPFWACFLYFQ